MSVTVGPSTERPKVEAAVDLFSYAYKHVRPITVASQQLLVFPRHGLQAYTAALLISPVHPGAATEDAPALQTKPKADFVCKGAIEESEVLLFRVEDCEVRVVSLTERLGFGPGHGSLDEEVM